VSEKLPAGEYEVEFNAVVIPAKSGICQVEFISIN
jgi:hypothetical protein